MIDSNMFQLVCFYAFAAVTVVAALGVITLRNSVHAVLSLVLTFFSTACIWLLAEAEFLAIGHGHGDGPRRGARVFTVVGEGAGHK